MASLLPLCALFHLRLPTVAADCTNSVSTVVLSQTWRQTPTCDELFAVRVSRECGGLQRVKEKAEEFAEVGPPPPNDRPPRDNLVVFLLPRPAKAN